MNHYCLIKPWKMHISCYKNS